MESREDINWTISDPIDQSIEQNVFNSESETFENEDNLSFDDFYRPLEEGEKEYDRRKQLYDFLLKEFNSSSNKVDFLDELYQQISNYTSQKLIIQIRGN
jgi:hypothetical protein